MLKLLMAKVFQTVLMVLGMPMYAALASPWIDAGWLDIEQNNKQKALTSWQQGVNGLDDGRQLIVLSVAAGLDSAIVFAQKAGRDESVFVVQSSSRGSMIYYVLSSRSLSVNPSDRSRQLASVREATGVQAKLFSDSASAFKTDSIKEIEKATLDRQAVSSAVSDGGVAGAVIATGAISKQITAEQAAVTGLVDEVVVDGLIKYVIVDSEAIPELIPLSGTAKREYVNIDFSQIDVDYDLGRFEEALWALEYLQKNYPHHGEISYRMGLLHEDMLDFESSRLAYEKALGEGGLKDPVQAYSHLGGLLFKLKQYPQAVNAFKQVVVLNSKDGNAFYMLGMLEMTNGDYPKSIAMFKQAGEVDAVFKQQGLYGQGLSYMRMYDGEKAQEVFRESIAIKPVSDIGRLAEAALVQATVLAETSYFSIFGMYGYQYDSNVVLKPSTSPNVPLITGVKDFEHTLLSVLTYAPPPSFGGTGYKASAMVYAQFHDRLSSFDITMFNATVTPYISLTKANVLSMDASFDYVLFNKMRYMDTIKLKPSLTYSHTDQLQLTLSLAASRENYYQLTAVPTSLQDGWMLVHDAKVTSFSKDHKSSMYAGGNFTISRTRGSDWSHNSYSGLAGVDVPMPYVKDLTGGLHGSIVRAKYQNIAVGYTQKRRDTIFNADVSLSYSFTYASVSFTGSYSHSVSNIPVFSYVKVMTGFNISESF